MAELVDAARLIKSIKVDKNLHMIGETTREASKDAGSNPASVTTD